MTIKQLSVFLENKTGRINDVVRTLGQNGINMHAFSMAETTDFGIACTELCRNVNRSYLPQLRQYSRFPSCDSGVSGRRENIYRIYVCFCPK